MIQSRLVKLSSNAARVDEDGGFSAKLSPGQMQNVQGLALKSATFLNNVYNVSADDLVFNFEALLVPYTASLPEPGFYNIGQIIAIIEPLVQTELQGPFPGTVVSMKVGEFSKKIEISISIGIVRFGPGPLNTLLGNTEELQILSSPNFTAVQTLPDLNGLDLGQIVVSTKTPKTILNASAGKTLWTNSVGMIPVDVPYGALQTYTNPSLQGSKVIFDHPDSLSVISWKVRDKNGVVLADQGPHLTIELVVWF
jgi:hypothetical protein